MSNLPEGLIEIHGMLIDQQGNVVTLSRYLSRDLAICALRSNKDCRGCVDCEDCYKCDNCHRCVGCTNCIGCISTHNSKDCARCYFSRNLEHCRLCHQCADCRNCIECLGTDHLSFKTKATTKVAKPLGEITLPMAPIPSIPQEAEAPRSFVLELQIGGTQ